ncbi:hypothetical protein C8J44_1756 [Sphingomonas sp. PP-CE-3A-406]|uniref:hypothetical protein n=1 Tax=Sphingomonas sp. PP-CE-3A-406 TaxID=2135659 RepID=UPI000F0F92F8|nr:hypothetical protein [Sphingomonas sp. PP-CE-3A-406]RMB54140.1 hypothetical protein C8J44_1756 [Sphingomonas sp. PP-CE-3A-406]
MKSPNDPYQRMQRIKVGLIGLAAVVLLIGLASAIIGSASRERPVAAVGAAQPDVVANMGVTNSVDAADPTEPLAEMGVAPSANGQGPTR